MQTSKFPLWICALTVCGGMTLHAEDTPAQAAARAGVTAAKASLQQVMASTKDRGIRKFARAQVKAAQREASSGQLWRSIGFVVKTYKGGVITVGIVGARGGFGITFHGKPRDPVYYAHLVEGGTKPHALGKGSSRRKSKQHGNMHPGTKPRPFLRPAWDATESEVQDVITAEMQRGIEKAMAKHMSRGAA